MVSVTDQASARETPTSTDSEDLASAINSSIDGFHITTVSNNPFEWEPTAQYAKGKEILAEVAKELRTYRHKSKAGAVMAILAFGLGIPIVLAAICLIFEIPRDDQMQTYTLVGLGVIAMLAVGISLAVGTPKEIDLDFGLAWYSISKGWGFSRENGRDTWRSYKERFPYFDCGSEDQKIKLRIWGKDETGQAFQLFHFYYETVTYVPHKVGKVWTVRKVETPHNRYGIFLEVPESKVRFRVSEDGGSFGKRVDFESGSFNDAVNVYCDPEDEHAVVKFISPAVIVEMERFFADLDGVTLDFYPGLVLVGTHHDFLGDGSVTLDKDAPDFEKALNSFSESIEDFRVRVDNAVDTFRKYND